jgi:hypothetical protein
MKWGDAVIVTFAGKCISFRHKSCYGALAAFLTLLRFSVNLAAAADVSLVALRTPKAPAAPHINGPKVYGIRPGRPYCARHVFWFPRPMMRY